MPQTPKGAFGYFNSNATSLNSEDIKNNFLHKLWIKPLPKTKELKTKIR
jgi:hypothetical protein